MACTQTLTSISTDCGSNAGGLVVVYARNRAEVSAVTVTDNVITAFTLTDSAPEAATLAFRKQTGSLQSTANIDDAAGVNNVTSELALRFAKMDTAKRVAIEALAFAETCMVVKDQNGKYWYLGYENPVTIAAYGGSTGTAKTDANEYTATFTDDSSVLPYEVSAEAVTAFINA